MIAPAQREQWWSDRLETNFEQARKLFALSAVQIGYAHGVDFIIADVPVITRKEGHDGLGPHQGVAIGDAIEIVTPIAPDVILVFGAEARYLELARGDVERYNRFQVRAFDRWLAARPLGESDQPCASRYQLGESTPLDRWIPVVDSRDGGDPNSDLTVASTQGMRISHLRSAGSMSTLTARRHIGSHVTADRQRRSHNRRHRSPRR